MTFLKMFSGIMHCLDIFHLNRYYVYLILYINLCFIGFCLCVLFYSGFLKKISLSKKRKKLWSWVCGKDLGVVVGAEVMIRKYCMKIF